MKNDLVDIIQIFLGAFIGWLLIYLWIKSLVLVGQFVVSEGIGQRVYLVVTALSLITAIMSMEGE